MNTMPYNQEAEQSVLGSVFLDPSLMKSLYDILKENDFFEERHQIIYQAMRKLTEEQTVIDYMTIVTELSNKALLKKVGGIEYVASLAETVPTTANIDAYVDIVKDCSLKRKIISTAQKIVEEGYNGNINSTDYVDFAENSIFEISKERKTTEFLKMADVLDNVARITEKNMANKDSRTGLITDFYALDDITSGLQKQDLIILAARPSMGKSALAMNLATNVAKKNKNGKAVVAIFSLEMSASQLASRMISSQASVDSKKIKTGHLDARDYRFFELGITELSNLNLFFDDSSDITVSDIRAKCRKLSQDMGLDLVVIDYLQLIKGENDRQNRQEEVAKISRSLKQMARELEIPVIALAQLSREVEKREEKTPIMADLRESGSIEQDADIVMFLYRDEYYKKDKSDRPGEADLIIAKNRQGSLGTIRLLWEPQFSRFKNKADDYRE